MPFKMLDYSDRATQKDLSAKFGVKGIPTLVLLDGSGKLITTDGRSALMTTPFESLIAK
jgi:hypothetical protein